MQWLLVKNGVIENIVAWDGITPWTPPDGYELVKYGGEPAAQIGWGWIDGHLVVPASPEPVEQKSPTVVE
jgi:hypothetical protein